MATQSIDVSRELPAALERLGLDVPERVIVALLTAERQEKGPCIAQCVHYGDTTLILWCDPAGFELPEHQHETQVQMSAVLEGRFRMTVNGTTEVCGPRSQVTIPAGTAHSGAAETRCIVIDVFQPRRSDFTGVEVV
jgi:hypothetical protein